MRVLAANVLNDTILALGMMICFYYGMTALASPGSSAAAAFRLLASTCCCAWWRRLLGGAALVEVTSGPPWTASDPEYGSGSHLGGVGLVLWWASGILVMGALFLGGAAGAGRVSTGRGPDRRRRSRRSASVADV